MNVRTNTPVEEFMRALKERNPNQPEFHQAVQEFA